jgi:carbonic anhydrase
MEVQCISTSSSKMPFDFNTAVRKRYDTLLVPRDFILSSGTPKPQILWVGCSDSFIIETETLDVLPEEIFVHRNLGSILHNRDLSSESALDWCLDLLKVRLEHQESGLMKF